MLWRGALDWPQFLTGRSMVIAGGMAAKLVVYPIGEGAREDRPLTNWAVLVKVGEGGAPPNKEDWSRPGRFEDLMPHVQRFRIPYVDAKALIEATPEFWEYPMCDRDPLPRWSHGRVTLLGDAAHPMYPVGSNGASQAILDARCLADRLVSAEHPMHALWAYEQERLPPTAQIVRMNRGGGPEGVIDAVEQRAPDGFTNIDDVLSFEERKAIVRGYAGVAGFARAGQRGRQRRRDFLRNGFRTPRVKQPVLVFPARFGEGGAEGAGWGWARVRQDLPHPARARLRLRAIHPPRKRGGMLWHDRARTPELRFTFQTAPSETAKAPPPLFSQGAGSAGHSIPSLREGTCSLTNVRERSAERRG